MCQRILLFALFLFLPAFAAAQNEVTVTDAVTGDETWTAENTYILDGYIYVEDGASLTIEAGTVVKGKPGQETDASALIVTRGAQIFADGTPANPIIFTAEADDVSDPDDTPGTRGLWGGVLILGNAPVTAGGDGEGQIEGIPATEPRGAYGGSDPADNSGVFRYVSIRHGGVSIGANNEINGLTMGGVGSGTVIEFVEVIYNLDDGFEWFGGTVNSRYLVSAFCGDDAFDYDQGFDGFGQFWFAIQDDQEAGHAGEFDGGEPDGATPTSTPLVYNATLIGPGMQASLSDATLNFKSNAGGAFHNSIFTDFPNTGITVEDVDGQATGDGRARLEEGDIALTHDIWFGFGAGNTIADFAPQDFVAEYLESVATYTVDPQLRGISRTDDGGLDPRPQDGSPANSLEMAAYPSGNTFFDEVDYLGAFGDELWISDWTFLARSGVTASAIEPIDNVLPSRIALRQNYPNPFVDETTIEFSLDRPQQVSLVVYDVLGRRVEVLADRRFSAGDFRATFATDDLPSGVYFYRLLTEQHTYTRTMTLAK